LHGRDHFAFDCLIEFQILEGIMPLDEFRCDLLAALRSVLIFIDGERSNTPVREGNGRIPRQSSSCAQLW
jgi:hypothetical protein